jgi:hypothetical protein
MLTVSLYIEFIDDEVDCETLTATPQGVLDVCDGMAEDPSISFFLVYEGSVLRGYCEKEFV